MTGVQRGLPQQFRQTMIALRPDDEIDGALLAQDFRAFGLRDTAGDGDFGRSSGGGARFFQHPHLAQFGKDLVGGFFADVAGIEDDQVGLFHDRRFRKALRRQHIRHARGVIDIHLAAIGFDEEFFVARWRGGDGADLDRGFGPNGLEIRCQNRKCPSGTIVDLRATIADFAPSDKRRAEILF